ncbi:MAG: hypothetical protein PHO26_10985 [Dehalococcoidia bacterium]|nr:hypothetical protein [Dehalococcoidia bacterium]MDD5493440.1 hypothetical protein [Dehalococcoidia bacterium]
MNTNIGKTAAIAVRITLILVLFVCLGSSVSCKPKDSVTYEVTGDADVVDIVISDDDGDLERFYDIGLPWRQDYGEFGQDYLYLYAYNKGESGTVIITIFVNGKVFKSETISGGYQSAVIVGNK